ncbi:AAA family ATPase [Nitriliruptor alkaliphilus]|uniref:AAA family ATPase n=1 Tax=Nitriliruptor alkaliphilus TaxID=427918 RepID=UPI000AADF83F|nr:AAA family ATPase [Nitriliruptor alkaliphilus]
MEQQQSVAASLGGALIGAGGADVGQARERARLRRVRSLAITLLIPFGFLWYRMLDGRPFNVFALPGMPDDPILYLVPLVLVLAIGSMAAIPFVAGRSPHVLYRPEQIDVKLSDVKGIEPIVEEVVRTLNTFLGYARFKDQLGGTPRRGLLFEGPPGTGKTYLAKALAREAGVPFLFVSATSFQSMWYGATARKIRAYFKALRKAARKEGGAIGFIEEIDAIALARGGMDGMSPAGTVGVSPCHPELGGMVAGNAVPTHRHERHLVQGTVGVGMRVDGMVSEGTGGIVNELLIQMQSFDTPPLRERMRNAVTDWLNGYLPAERQLQRAPAAYHNLLLIAATNRADRLDPALLRPGRFDRQLTFEVPAKAARRELIDHLLERKAHDPDLDREEQREVIAGQTFGYTPVMIEHLLDESLLHALRDGRDALSFGDVQSARLTEEVGLKNPVEYTPDERRVVATHEAGHATVAFLTQRRRLEVLSIVKRSGSLGLLAHGDLEEVYTRSSSELHALIDIAMGGMVAEEQYFGESSTGPSGDLMSATQVACQLVGAAGLGGSLVSLAAYQQGPLGGSDLVGRTLGDPHTRPEVDRILAVSKARARAMIAANSHILEALRDALLDRDELIGEEIIAVCESAGPAVREGLAIERRGEDRRRRDWLAESDPTTPWAGIDGGAEVQGDGQRRKGGRRATDRPGPPS